jgi:hypothetical protein
MKRTTLFTFILTLILGLNQAATAQKANFETNGGMTIGFGMGPSYQQSDLANPNGGGFDFTLGSFIYKRDNAFLSVDWKFRFLMGENWQHDHRINIDGTFSNVKYSFFDYDAEIGLTLNRLREKTRIVVTGFAGAGITHGRTFTDLYDTDGSLYDYSVINTNQSQEQIYADLLELSDKEYETPLTNKAAILPTAGIFIGYQFTRSFSLGIEHKTKFSLTENNSFTGINIDNKIVPGSVIDMNHYTALSFIWNLGGGGGRSSRVYSPPTYSYPSAIPSQVSPYSPPVSNVSRTVNDRPPVTEPTNPIINTTTTTNVRNETNTGNTNPTSTTLPILRFVNPSSPITVNTNIFNINVHTQYVRAWQDVKVMVNNIETTNFNFSPDGVVTTNIGLREGINTVVVSGKNDAGTAQAQAQITFTPSANMPSQPVDEVPPVTAPSNRNQNPPVVAENTPRTPGSRVVTPREERPPVVEPKPEVIVPEPEPEVIVPPVVEPEPEVIAPPVVEPEPEVIAPPVVEPEPEVIAPPVVEPEPEVIVPPVVEPEPEPEVVSPPAPEPEPEVTTCGIRFSPGNSADQFCIITPSGTISRNNLTNANFSYSGPASSLYFLATAGGGNATINGKPYTIRAGQYYLFTGNLTVIISTKNPGSMGQWSVCVTANREPQFGNGNSRPKSPCSGSVIETVIETVKETVSETSRESSREPTQETEQASEQETEQDSGNETERGNSATRTSTRR